MNEKICARCNQPNKPEMSFCLNCGAELSQISADDLPPTVFGGFPTNPQAGQTSPNFQPQQPNFQQQQPNFQPHNFQQPNFQAAPENGGQTNKILLGVGGAVIGLIIIVVGGIALYKAYDSRWEHADLANYSNGNTSNTGNKSNTNNVNKSNSTTNNNSSSALTIADMTQQNVGDWSLRDTIVGNPEKDGFSGASEEKQFKYYDASGAMVHLTIAQYPFAYDAQKALRASMEKFKSMKLKTSEETAMGDNNQNEIGITQTMESANGKIFTRYWTNKNFLFRALGTKTEVEDFVKNSEN